MPVTTPTVLTDAIEELLLLQVPPVTALFIVVEPPTHTLIAPVIGAIGFTVSVPVAVHPAPDPAEYEMVVVPPDTPEANPVDDPTTPTDVLLLLHVPPGVASLNDVVLPAHTTIEPIIGATAATTFTGVVELHP